MRYQVKDIQTKEVKGVYATRKQASSKADKLDSAYGAIRYTVVMVEDLEK